MKKLLLNLVELLTVFTLALLLASCGGGGGGGGSDDYFEPAPEPTPTPVPVTPEQNENSVLEIKAPTYTQRTINITPTSNTFAAGSSVTFTAEDGYASYTWYVGGVQKGTENPLVFTMPSGTGPLQLMLVVTDSSGNYYSSTKSFTVTAAN